MGQAQIKPCWSNSSQSSRLFALRTLIPHFHAQQNIANFLHSTASANLPQIIPHGCAFAEELLHEYRRKTSEGNFRDSRAAPRWAKAKL